MHHRVLELISMSQTAREKQRQSNSKKKHLPLECSTVEPLFEHTKREKHKRDVARNNIRAEKKRRTLKASSLITLLGTIPTDQYHLGSEEACQLPGQTLQLYHCVLTQGTPFAICGGRGPPLPEDDQFGRDFFPNKKPKQANLSDGRSLDGDSPPKRSEMDACRRAVITAPTRP